MDVTTSFPLSSDLSAYPRRRDIFARFSEKYAVDGECWIWSGFIDHVGYGRFWFDGRMELAHRAAYELFVGPIPKGWVVAQSCENRDCVNPEHLFAAELPRPRRSTGTTQTNKQVYQSAEWRRARRAALDRDERGCTVSRFFAGECGGHLHVHHIVPLAEGGAPYDVGNLGTVCARHHPLWEALRRDIVRELNSDDYHRVTCTHRHPTREAREICERRMARQRERAVAA